MNIQGFYEVFACQVSQPVSPVSSVDSVPWPRVSRSDDVWSLVMSLMISMWSLCKWSVIGGWVSDKRLPATKRVITGPWWQGNSTQVDRTSLFLIESQIQRLCLITTLDNQSPTTIRVISAPHPQEVVGVRLWECHSVTRGQRKQKTHTLRRVVHYKCDIMSHMQPNPHHA